MNGDPVIGLSVTCAWDCGCSVAHILKGSVVVAPTFAVICDCHRKGVSAEDMSEVHRRMAERAIEEVADELLDVKKES